MKKLLLTAAAILATLNMYGQGQGSLTFSTVGAPADKRVWLNTTGVVGEGVQAGGTAYAVALYWGAATETDDRNLVQIGGSTTFFAAGTAQAGNYSGGGRTITYQGNSANGAVLAFQVRGWSTADGASYEAVVASGRGFAGKGRIFTLDTKNELDTLETKPNIWDTVKAPGYNGFSITPVPEPSVIGLGLLGAGALLMLRRRK